MGRLVRRCARRRLMTPWVVGRERDQSERLGSRRRRVRRPPAHVAVALRARQSCRCRGDRPRLRPTVGGAPSSCRAPASPDRAWSRSATMPHQLNRRVSIRLIGRRPHRRPPGRYSPRPAFKGRRQAFSATQDCGTRRSDLSRVVTSVVYEATISTRGSCRRRLKTGQ